MQLEWTESAPVARWRERAGRLIRFLEAVWDQVLTDKLVIRASGLAYASLLAIVPLIAVVFALFTAFEAFDQLRQRLQDLLLTHFLPSGQEQITSYIDTFVENSRDLGFVGFVVLVVTALLLLDNIDWNFNEIWHVRSRRTITSRVMAYTSVLVFGTMLLGISVSVSAWVKTALLADVGSGLRVLSTIGSWTFPLAASFLAYLLLFVIVPATGVRWRSAAVGAAFSAVTWELGKNVFAVSVGESVRYSKLYGSLAAIPIFLIWLYVTWILVLVGLEIAYTHQNYAALVRRRVAGSLTGRAQLVLALEIVTRVARRFDAGEPPPELDDLEVLHGVEGGVVSDMIERLVDKELIRKVEDGSSGAGFVPAVPLNRLSVADVIAAVWGRSPGDRAGGGDELAAEAEQLVATFESAGREAIGELDLRQLLERSG